MECTDSTAGGNEAASWGRAWATLHLRLARVRGEVGLRQEALELVVMWEEGEVGIGSLQIGPSRYSLLGY